MADVVTLPVIRIERHGERTDAEKLRDAMRALQVADDLISYHRDYSTMPSDDFRAKHGDLDPTRKFSELRRAYVEARDLANS